MAKKNGGAAVADPSETVEAATPETKIARHCGTVCLFCGCKGAAVHFEEGAILFACEDCKGAVRLAANVIRKPEIDKLRDKIGSRYELGLVGKANYSRMTGTKTIPGRSRPEKDPTDAESEEDIARAVAPNAKAKAAAKKAATEADDE